VWNPPDPDEPTSEIYWLMPPRRRPSQLREALDAACGTGSGGGDLIMPPRRRRRALAAKARPASRRALGWAWGLATLTLAGILIPRDLRRPVRPLGRLLTDGLGGPALSSAFPRCRDALWNLYSYRSTVRQITGGGQPQRHPG